MLNSLKAYTYTKGTDAALDAEFAGAAVYSRVKLGSSSLFWKSGFRWYAISLTRVQRIFRRVEHVYGKLCCGGQNFDIEQLVLVLSDGSQLEVYIGDDVRTHAQSLLQALKDEHPEIRYGKE